MKKDVMDYAEFLERVEFYIQDSKDNATIQRLYDKKWTSITRTSDYYAFVKIYQRPMGPGNPDIGCIYNKRKGSHKEGFTPLPFLYRTERDAKTMARRILDWISDKEIKNIMAL